MSDLKPIHEMTLPEAIEEITEMGHRIALWKEKDISYRLRILFHGMSGERRDLVSTESFEDVARKAVLEIRKETNPMVKDGFVNRTFAIAANLDKRLDVYVQRFNLCKTEEGQPQEKIDKGQLVNQAIEELLRDIDEA